MATQKITDIEIICSQCNIELEEAQKLYVKANGNIIDAIIMKNHYNVHSITKEEEQTKKELSSNENNKTEAEKKIEEMRNILNEKDKIFMKKMEQFSTKNTIKSNIEYSSKKLPISTNLDELKKKYTIN